MPNVLFGAYSEASTDADITNAMKLRTHPCISLGPSGIMQGSSLKLSQCLMMSSKQSTGGARARRLAHLVTNWNFELRQEIF